MTLSRQRNLGVTLIEILVTLTIIAVLAIVAIPSLSSLIKNQRLIGSTENLYSALQNARYEAIKRNTTVYVSFTTGSNWCYGLNSGSRCDCTTPANCNLGAVTALNTQLTLSQTGLTGTPASLSFESTHGSSGQTSALTFTETNETPAMTVTVNAMGNTSICTSSTQIGGYTAC